MDMHHHDDDTMPVMDIRWVLVTRGKHDYWIRDEHHEALKVLREAGMLPDVTQEELPS